MKTVALIAALSAFALSTGAHAAAEGAAPVALLTPVTFAASTDKREEVKQQCQLGEVLAARIGAALNHLTKGPGTTMSNSGEVVKVNVLTIWGARGNNWTGPKGLVIHVDLLRDGATQRSAEFHRTTMGGFKGPFMGICGFMDRNAESLGKDVARWVREPGYAGDTSAAPADEPASAASN
jgi:hypothetical protein